MSRSCHGSLFALTAALALSATPLLAADADGAHAGSPAPLDWRYRDTLTGDWNGARTALADWGLDISSQWIVDTAGNPTGGIRHGTAVAGEFYVQFDFDLEKLVNWQGASIVSNVYWVQGSNLSDDVGNLLTISSEAGTPGVRLNALYLQNEFANGALTTRIGQIDVGPFWNSETSSLFVNSTFGWPGINGLDLPSGGPNSPLATPGAYVKWKPYDTFYIQAAAYNGNPLGGSYGNTDGLDFPLDDGAFAILEATIEHRWANGLKGTWRVGAWYNSEGFDDVAYSRNGLSLASPYADAPLRLDDNYAVYAILDHELWKDEISTLSGFIRLAAAPEDRNHISFYLDTGVALAAPFASRPNDKVGIAFAYAKISPEIADLARAENAFSGVNGPIPDYEAVLEVSYQAAIIPGFDLQPFFQYIFNPGGNIRDPASDDPAQSIEDAAVFGLRAQVTF